MLNHFSLGQIFIGDAMASDVATPAASEFSFSSFVPLILIFGVFYFLIIRPQSKKFKDHQEMVNSIKSGAKVVTTGGIFGEVKTIYKDENAMDIEIADGVVIKILKNHVADLVKKEKDKKEVKASKKKGK
jgi:preprotein translocase subunit YajC